MLHVVETLPDLLVLPRVLYIYYTIYHICDISTKMLHVVKTFLFLIYIGLFTALSLSLRTYRRDYAAPFPRAPPWQRRLLPRPRTGFLYPPGAHPQATPSSVSRPRHHHRRRKGRRPPKQTPKLVIITATARPLGVTNPRWHRRGRSPVRGKGC